MKLSYLLCLKSDAFIYELYTETILMWWTKILHLGKNGGFVINITIDSFVKLMLKAWISHDNASVWTPAGEELEVSLSVFSF